MDSRHRNLIKKYSYRLQSIDQDENWKDSLRKSKIFTTCMLKDIYDGEASLFEELPTRGPYAFDIFIGLLKKHGHPIADELYHVSIQYYHISNPRGSYVILSNNDFKENSSQLLDLQRGCSVEATALDKAVKTIGYECYKYKTKVSSDKLRKQLIKFSKKDFKDVNSCIVIILSLGAEINGSKVIYGSDGNYVLLRDIVNLFSDKNCPSLKYKPKIFLLPSFDIPHSDNVENVDLRMFNDDVNDTFLWCFPSSKNYKLAENNKFFGEILSENIENNYLEFDFEAIFKLSYFKFNGRFDDIPDHETIGYHREKILFNSTA